LCLTAVPIMIPVIYGETTRNPAAKYKVCKETYSTFKLDENGKMHISPKCFTFTNRCTYLLVLESTKIYIKIHTKMLLLFSVCDHHQGARTWA